LNGDEGEAQKAQKASQLKWDRKKKRFVKGDGIGSNNEKMIRSESGALLPASFKSGKFDEWKQRTRNTPRSDPPTRPVSRHPGARASSRHPAKELATAESILKDRRDKMKVSILEYVATRAYS
jgi:ATP-dependent RNA helicase DDX54/DBP10